jgi:hypothetical protein
VKLRWSFYIFAIGLETDLNTTSGEMLLEMGADVTALSKNG